MADDLTPMSPSSDYEAMKPYWDKVDAILGGVDTMRAADRKFLPKLPNESDADYKYRVENAPFTNIYDDVASGLVSRLFREEIGVAENADARIVSLVEDIDGRGNHLHVFAAGMGWNGVNYAIDWVLVDYTKAPPGRTLAEEKASGARPYWVHIPAKHMLAVYSGVVQGTEIICHARIHEPVKVRDGLGENLLNRVRILNREPIYSADNAEEIIGYGPATWELWQEGAADLRTKEAAWRKIGNGAITIGVIPLAQFVTGRRQSGSWKVRPALQSAVDKQIEHFRRETNLWATEERTAFPMLAGNGVSPPLDANQQPIPLQTGPNAVLYAPPVMGGDTSSHGEWEILEPSADSLKYLQSQVDACEKQLRELGKQPLTAQSGNLTVVSSAMAANKSISTIEAWGLSLKDTLENALKFTAMWLNQPDGPEVTMNLDDLTLDLEGDTSFTDLLSMRKNGDLSQGTLWAEAKRRGRLSPEFDPEKEKAALIAEMPEGGEEEVDNPAAPVTA